MNVLAFLASLAWVAVTAYAVWRFAQVAERFAPPPPKDFTPTPVPHDLLAFALSHPEEWAQEDVLRAIRERYETTSDWNAVRAAFGIGRMDA